MIPGLDTLIEQGAAELVDAVRGVMPAWLRPLLPKKKATAAIVAGVGKLLERLDDAGHLSITAPSVRVRIIRPGAIPPSPKSPR